MDKYIRAMRTYIKIAEKLLAEGQNKTRVEKYLHDHLEGIKKVALEDDAITISQYNEIRNYYWRALYGEEYPNDQAHEQ